MAMNAESKAKFPSNRSLTWKDSRVVLVFSICATYYTIHSIVQHKHTTHVCVCSSMYPRAREVFYKSYAVVLCKSAYIKWSARLAFSSTSAIEKYSMRQIKQANRRRSYWTQMNEKERKKLQRRAPERKTVTKNWRNPLNTIFLNNINATHIVR